MSSAVDSIAEHMAFLATKDNPDYRARYQSLEINIENRTNFRLEFLGDYFETGVWYSNPGHHVLEPNKYRRYIVTSQMGTFLKGVTGVLKYRLEIISVDHPSLN